MPDTTSPVEYQQGNFLSMQHQAMENYTGVPTKEVRRLFLVCFTFIPHSPVPPSWSERNKNLESMHIIIKIIRGHSRFPIRNCKGRLQFVNLRILKRSYIWYKCNSKPNLHLLDLEPSKLFIFSLLKNKRWKSLLIFYG